MRVAIVGSPAERARLRAQMNGSMEVVGEYATLTEARAADADVDAIVVDPDTAPAAAVDRRERALADAVDGEQDFQEPLTAREIDVLELLAEGMPNKAIAARLHISDQTVKFHVASISGKLGAANRTDAVRRAVRRGLITL
jgi:ATP/maltotriose-dependent transcriptional regulator MalT